MTRDERLALFEPELDRLLTSGRTHDYVVFSDVGRPERYVYCLRNDTTVRVEVRPSAGGSSQLRRTAVGCIGFRPAEDGSYVRELVDPPARKLACLVELAFGAAYGATQSLTPVAMSRPRAEEELERRIGEPARQAAVAGVQDDLFG